MEEAIQKPGCEEMTEAAASSTQWQIFKVALASIIGSPIEQFDFLVTGVIAATVWGDIFFKLPGVAAVSARIGVYGIGIIIRSIGAYIFGIIADRRGYKDAGHLRDDFPFGCFSSCLSRSRHAPCTVGSENPE
jgi:hypothetical protein